MPLIAYSCDCGHILKKYFRQVIDAPAVFACNKCEKEMKKTLSSPSNSSKITVDNGIQARAVEITPDIVEINQERSNKNYREE